MDRPLRNGLPRSQDHPVLVFEGARGTGKTAMLDRWTGLLDQVVPFARIDFDANLDVSQPKLLTALAFELSRRCADLLTLRFPRFTTGRLVMRMSLDLERTTSRPAGKWKKGWTRSGARALWSRF